MMSRQDNSALPLLGAVLAAIAAVLIVVAFFVFRDRSSEPEVREESAAAEVESPPTILIPEETPARETDAAGEAIAVEYEESLRLNNLGIAQMEQFQFAEATGSFRSARQLDPENPAFGANLGIALFYDGKVEEAIRVLKEVIRTDPRQRETRFVLALAERNSGNLPEAQRHVKVVIAEDPRDPGAQYLAGVLESAQRSWDRAIAHFQAALTDDPWNESVHYGLAKAQIQKGERAEAEKSMARFQELKAGGYGTSFGTRYLEHGRYAEVVRATGTPGIIDRGGMSRRPRFFDAAGSSGLDFIHGGPVRSSGFPAVLSEIGSPDAPPLNLETVVSHGSGAAFLDFDGDVLPDIFFANASADGRAEPVLFRNLGGGKFGRVSDTGIQFPAPGMGVAAGDYDNDGRPDLLLTGFGRIALFRNEGKGKFSDVTPILPGSGGRGLWSLSAAFVDLDHDGDLDVYVSCAAEFTPAPGDGTVKEPKPGGNLLFRNNGDGTFSETASSSGTGQPAGTAFVSFLDFNRSRDIDLLLVGARSRLYSNRRDGSFAALNGMSGIDITGQPLGVATGDFDGDGWIDICSPAADGSVRIFWNRERSYQFSDLKLGAGMVFWSAQAFDYDNDGDRDILLLGSELRLLENLGSRRFRDVSSGTGLGRIPALNPRSVAVADYDRDGDLDLLITRSGHPPLLLRNDGGNGNRALRLTLEGRTDNRSGFGSRIDWAARGLWQSQEHHGALGYLSQSSVDVLLGLGRHESADYVRVLWPTGVLQTEVPPKDGGALKIVELDRKGTSCPILYAWDGKGYGFVTDFLGGSAVGYLVAPGTYAVPDTDEYVKIRRDQLVPRGGVVSLKMVNQLEEVILFDMVRLLAVDHPAEIEIFPNERLLTSPPFPEFRIHTAGAPRPVRSAVDDEGRSWTSAVRKLDRKYVEGFRLLPFKGYAEEHGLVLDLGDLRGAKRVLLLLDGWIDYASSSSNFAASQAGLKLVAPYLQVWQEAGGWQTVVKDMGFPAGLPKTITVDLTGKLPLSPSARIRIGTNMRIYWDRIRLETAEESPSLRVTTLMAAKAETAWVGYPRSHSVDGLPPYGYLFDMRDALAPWKTHLGGYTALGDVRTLLESADECYVVLSHGEAIHAAFTVNSLPPLPAGWTRDWLLHVDGYGKDMDLHSAWPDRLEPFPRHRDLPYRADHWQSISDDLWEKFRRLRLVRPLGP